jgi:hypothetical protein
LDRCASLNSGSGLNQIDETKAQEQGQSGYDLEINDAFQGKAAYSFKVIGMSGNSHDQRSEKQWHNDAFDQPNEQVRDNAHTRGRRRELPTENDADNHCQDDPMTQRKAAEQRKHFGGEDSESARQVTPKAAAGLVQPPMNANKREWEMKTHIIHIAVGTLLMILCAVGAVFIPPLWQGAGGRDFRPQAFTMALLIFALASLLRAWRHWPMSEFIGAFLCAEFFTLCVIAHFSGNTWLQILDRFNMLWLGWMSLFVGLPWLLGLVVGSLLLRRRPGKSP